MERQMVGGCRGVKSACGGDVRGCKRWVWEIYFLELFHSFIFVQPHTIQFTKIGEFRIATSGEQASSSGEDSAYILYHATRKWNDGSDVECRLTPRPGQLAMDSFM